MVEDNEETVSSRHSRKDAPWIHRDGGTTDRAITGSSQTEFHCWEGEVDTIFHPYSRSYPQLIPICKGQMYFLHWNLTGCKRVDWTPSSKRLMQNEHNGAFVDFFFVFILLCLGTFYILLVFCLYIMDSDYVFNFFVLVCFLCFFIVLNSVFYFSVCFLNSQKTVVW